VSAEDLNPNIEYVCAVCGSDDFLWGGIIPGITFSPDKQSIFGDLLSKGLRAACCQNCGYIMLFYKGKFFMKEKRGDKD